MVYAYDRWQPTFDRMQKKDGILFHRGLPDPSHLTEWFGPTRGGVLVLDDLMEEGGQDKRVLDLFTKDSHYRNITVLYLTQDLFPPGKFSKTINQLVTSGPFGYLMFDVYPASDDRYRLWSCMLDSMLMRHVTQKQ